MQYSFTCEQANNIDLVEYLKRLGHQPQKIKSNDYWYLSPLHEEKNASFKVNRQRNIWFDHSLGKGGTLVDFGILLYNCAVKEFLQKLGSQGENFSFHQQNIPPAIEKKNTPDDQGKIKVLSAGDINDSSLLQYLDERQISPEVARKFCKEICFELYNKNHLAIGFKNNRGGYELRSRDFKGSSSPKEPRLIAHDEQKSIAVFEGFFSFLSHQTLRTRQEGILDFQPNFLVLNSLSFFEKSREVMERFPVIDLYLDHDIAGIKNTQDALKWSTKYRDKSSLYAEFKDLNEYLKNSKKHEIRQVPRTGRRI